MKVLVCGGRNFTNLRQLKAILDKLHKESPITMLVQGGASGADSLAQLWASTNRVPRETHSAQWSTFGKAAGIVRNVKMLTLSRPDLVVAFPGGRGTAHMVAIAKETGVKVIQVSTDEA